MLRARRGAPPHPDHRPHARRPRRADHLRAQAARLGDRAPPRPRAARRRPRGRARRQAVRRRRHLRQLRSPRRGLRPVGARAGARGRRDAGDPPRPARDAAGCDRRSSARRSTGSRPRSATCSAPRCARCWSRSPRARRARRRCRTSRTRSSASGSADLARVLRANALVGLENVPLWHERDISHSSAERVVLPDSTIGLDYMLDRFTWLIEGLVVDAERMLRNLEASHGLVFSGRALLALVESGMSREVAYEVVQRNALRAWDEGAASARPAGGRSRRGPRPGRGRARPGVRPGRLPASRRRRVRPHHRAAGADPCLTISHAPTRHPARCASCTATATRS